MHSIDDIWNWIEFHKYETGSGREIELSGSLCVNDITQQNVSEHGQKISEQNFGTL